jgi:hypothetical protein
VRKRESWDMHSGDGIGLRLVRDSGLVRVSGDLSAYGGIRPGLVLDLGQVRDLGTSIRAMALA